MLATARKLGTVGARNVLLRERSAIRSSSSTGSTSNKTMKNRRVDPTAKRPNKKCDPYGQGGKPMSMIDAERLIRTLDPGWSFDISEVDHSDDNDRKNHKLPAGLSLIREFVHPDFLAGAAFTSKIAAVSAMNDHYPSLQLHRRIVRKNWEVVTQVRCHTLVLGGLSMHDFHLAMMIDVEVGRAEVQKLLLRTKEDNCS